jgi:hypothetical protein
MQFGYSQPFSFQLRPRLETKVSSVRHGVTEIALSDGRLVRAMLHISGVTQDPKRPGTLAISYAVVTEVLPLPEMPIRDVHETIQ